MKTKKIVMSLISGTLAAVMACGGAFAASVRTTTDVNMRAKPDNASAVLCVLPKNAEAEKLGMEGNWYHLSYKDKDGYVYKKYIKDTEAAPATETKTVYTTGDLHVRAKPTKNSEKLGVLKKGTAVETTGLKNGWYTIKYNGKTGYISAKYTTETKPETTKTVYTTGDLYVRAKPTKNSEKLGVLKKGTAVETTGMKDGWYKITYKGKTGYISGKYVTTTKPGTAETTIVYTTANLNVRDKATTEGKKLGVLKKGTAVETTGLKNGWYTIKYNGKTGYISAKYTTETKPETTKTVYTTGDLYVRAKPTKNSEKLGVLKKGTAVETTGMKDGWYKITYKGKTGYISGKYVTTTKPGTAETTIVYTTANLNVRDKATTEGKKLGVLKKGTAVETLGLKNGWYTIKYNGKTGYISAKYTTEVKPGTEKPTTPATKTVYTTSDLNVRAEPNKNAKKLGVLKKGTEVKTITLKNGWYSIAYNGKTGYISAKYTTDKR